MLDYVVIEARRQPDNQIVLTKRIARNQQIGVGRTDAADLVVNDDPEMSGLHFVVAVGDEACTITDQKSTNKTFYDGRPITQINIGDGERILCGKTEFTFRLVTTSEEFPFGRPVADGPRRPASRSDSSSVPTSKADLPARADPLAGPNHVPPPESTPPAPPKRTQPSIPAPTHRSSIPPASSSNIPVPAAPTDSGELIDWNVFSEQAPVTRRDAELEISDGGGLHSPDKRRQQTSEPPSFQPFVAEGASTDSEKTQVIFGTASAGRVVHVVIGIAGRSEPSARLVIDPRQNSQAVVGRAPSSQLSCPLDRTMSRAHFAIEIQDHQCQIRDLNSRNGVSLNGQRILTAPLQHGDRVRAGQTEFEVEIEFAR
jgi:pSer/pThr/pTyr-binding forkhead associated (FHA) protein